MNTTILRKLFPALPDNMVAQSKGVEVHVVIDSGRAVEVVQGETTIWPADGMDISTALEEAGLKKAKKIQVDDAWISHLEEHINQMGITKEGDEIRLRVARSNGRPVCAHLDLFQDRTKVETAGRDHRINFATSGINDQWTERVREGVEFIYDKMASGKRSKQSGQTRTKVDDAWISHLEEHINQMGITKEGDEIRLRVARSNGRPVCAHLDLYRADEKILTAGRDHRINFATSGINDQWAERVREGVEFIYELDKDRPRVLKSADAEVTLKGDWVEMASGSVVGILQLIREGE